MPLDFAAQTLREYGQDLQQLDQLEQLEWVLEQAGELEHIVSSDLAKLQPVPGCISHTQVAVWQQGEHVVLVGESSSQITRGLLAILQQYLRFYPYSALKVSFESEWQDFLENTGLQTGISPRRSFAFNSVLQQVKELL